MQVFARTVCPIQYEWVKDMLPKLHEVDVHMLSGAGVVEKDAETKYVVLHGMYVLFTF